MGPSVIGFRKRSFGTFAFGNFLGNDIDAENVTSGIFQRVPVRKPDTLCVTAARSLALTSTGWHLATAGANDGKAFAGPAGHTDLSGGRQSKDWSSGRRAGRNC
jgi:hypothetical protein